MIDNDRLPCSALLSEASENEDTDSALHTLPMVTMKLAKEYQSTSASEGRYMPRKESDTDNDTHVVTQYVQKKQKITCRLILTIIGVVMGSLSFGYNLGVVNNAEKLIKDFINQTEVERTGSAMSETTLRNLWALTASVFAVGGCIGGLCGGWWATRLGRKRGSLINALQGLVSVVIMFTSTWAKSYEMIIVGRVLIGINAGLYSALCPLYLSEISTCQIRGAVGVLHQLAIVSGILIAQILGFPIILGNADSWHYLLGLAVVPCLLQLVILPSCPESPRYLLITCHDEERCKQALVTLRGTHDVEMETEEIRQEMQSGDEKVSMIQVFRTPSLRAPMIIGIVMQLSQQFSGINGIFFYSTNMFEEAGLSATTATYTTSAVGAIMVTMTIVTVPLMDRAGRRTLHLMGLLGMTFFSILITITLALRDQVEWFKIGSIVVMLLYVVFFALGPGSIPWLIVSELFSHGARPAALSVCVLVNWLSSFLVGYIFPNLQAALQDYTFVPFTVLLVLFSLFTYLKVPETKGKTFEEVSAVWKVASKDRRYDQYYDNLDGESQKSSKDVNFGSNSTQLTMASDISKVYADS